MGGKAANFTPAMREWDKLEAQLPSISEQELQYILPEIVGEYGPEMEQYLGDLVSEYSSIESDPRLRDSQLSVLDYLAEVGETGLTASERAALNEIRRATQQEAEAKQQQIIQNMAQRGAGGSGAELAARLSGAQSAADRMSRESDQLAMLAQQRALQAMMQQGQMAGNLRTQDFNEASSIAQAKDAMNTFNRNNQQSLQQRNIGARNQAQLQNLQQRQAVSDAATALKNQQQQYNKGLLQQQFQNQLDINRGRAGIASAQAQANQQANASNQAGMWQAFGTLGGAAMMFSDENKKKNIKKATSKIRDLLDNLDAYEYEYKEPEKYGEGEHVSVMAQDLEKSDLGKDMIVDTEEGKMVDYSKSLPAIMASLGEMHKRISKLEKK